MFCELRLEGVLESSLGKRAGTYSPRPNSTKTTPITAAATTATINAATSANGILPGLGQALEGP